MNRTFAAALLAACSFGLRAQELPEGPGREEMVKLCKQCHEVARSISLRQDRDGWSHTMNKMVAFGMKASEQEINSVLDYLTKNFPAEEVPRLNVNTAAAIEMESALSLRRSQARAVIAWREKNGPFKSLEEFKKVPGLEAEKIDAKKDRIIFN